MLHSVHLISLAMAVVAALWAFAASRSQNATPEVRRASASTMLIACAVMIGVTPQALLPDNETLQTVGPVASIVVSVITLYFLRRWRTRSVAR